MLDEDKVTQPNILIHASDHKRETKRVISGVWGYDAFIKEIDLVEYIGPQMMKLMKCLFADAEIWTGVKSDGSDRLRYSIVWAWQPAQTEQSWATTRHVASLSRGRGIINNLNMNMNTLWAGTDMDTTTQKQIQSGTDCCWQQRIAQSSDVINDPIFSIFVSQDGQSRVMRGEDGLGAPPSCCLLHHVNTGLS